MLRTILVAGARPNFMKVAPLCRVLKRRQAFERILVHTGQHYDAMMSGVFFEELEIPYPDINLDVGSHPRDEQIAIVEARFEPIVRDLKPDLVVVVGDVNSTVACARVARRSRVKVAHVEAGLRSFDARMPEELNRIETDMLADLLFVTEPSGMEHLQAEAAPGKKFLVGNVMIDTLVHQLGRIRGSDILRRLRLRPREYVAATFHRPSNVDTVAALKGLLATIAAVCERLPTVLALHPRTIARIKEFELEPEVRRIGRLVLSDPLGYCDFLKLVMDSRAVITDSGGIQEETTFLRVPCITMRESTERPVTVEQGTNVIVGSDHNAVLRNLDLVTAGGFKKGTLPRFWDGHAAERIVDIVAQELGGVRCGSAS